MVSAIEACTGVKVRSHRRINTGWENYVIEVNDRYIFRFPRFQTSWKRTKKEILLTPLLAKHLRAHVPEYKFVWEGDRKFPERFAGYRKIEGEPLTERNFRHAWLPTLGRDLGKFLTELHGLRLPRAVSPEVPSYTPKSWAMNTREFYQKVRRYAYPALSADAREKADTFWSRLLSNFETADFDPTFIHGDLTGGNVILDRGAMRGVIDWGDAEFADPALDFVGFFQTDRRLGRAVLESYRKETRGFLDRIDLYLKTIPFGEVAWGVQQRSDYHRWLGLKHLAHWTP